MMTIPECIAKWRKVELKECSASDPTDEPAATLLERIRKERETTGQPARTKTHRL